MVVCWETYYNIVCLLNVLYYNSRNCHGSLKALIPNALIKKGECEKCFIEEWLKLFQKYFKGVFHKLY